MDRSGYTRAYGSTLSTLFGSTDSSERERQVKMKDKLISVNFTYEAFEQVLVTVVSIAQ